MGPYSEETYGRVHEAPRNPHPSAHERIDELKKQVGELADSFATMSKLIVDGIKNQYEEREQARTEIEQALERRIVDLENAVLEQATRSRTDIKNAIRAYDTRGDAE